MTKSFAIGRFALAVALLAFAGTARAEQIIEFTPTSADPNDAATPNTGSYGSDVNVSVGYSPYVYSFSHGYGTLDGGTGAAVYSDNDAETLVMTFTAAAGYTVSLDSFNLATYDGETGSYGTVDISVTGDSSSYTMNGAMPSPTLYTTYLPAVSGSVVTLTITNLYDVGINTIEYSETAVASVPEPSSVVMMGTAGLFALAGVARGRRKKTA